MFGPVFYREAVVAPKRPRLYLSRSLYLLVLLLLLCTGYLVLSGMRPLRTASDLSRFGGAMFLLLAPLQMLVLTFLAAVGAASSVAQEKDRRTLILMLLTRLTGSEVVVGKLAASLIAVLFMLLASFPLFFSLPLFGGVSTGQIASMYLVTLVTILLAAAAGTVVGLWREKTFQSIAFTVLAIVLWLAFWEILAMPFRHGGTPDWLAYLSPIRAMQVALSPLAVERHLPSATIGGYGVFSLAITILICVIGASKVRVWNPSREIRFTPPQPEGRDDTTPQSTTEPTTATWKVRSARPVWSNPILWREVCTWAYGKKIVLIRLAYLLICLLVAMLLYQTISSGTAFERTGVAGRALPAATLPLAAVGVISLFLVNALAVNSITTERDVLALDLLLVTDLRPLEFISGKILGVFFVTKEMIVVPLGMLVALGLSGVMTWENTFYAVLGALALYVFVATVGIHCGLNYPAGRTATLISLGTIFFLCIGVAICMVIMTSFRGAFELQLGPFLAMILGGGAGLYAALGWRNPSSAIFLASFSLPMITFYAITQFLLQRDQLFVFMPVVAGYGFATTAMLVPALSEFDVSFSQGSGGEQSE